VTVERRTRRPRPAGRPRRPCTALTGAERNRMVKFCVFYYASRGSTGSTHTIGTATPARGLLAKISGSPSARHPRESSTSWRSCISTITTTGGGSPVPERTAPTKTAAAPRFLGEIRPDFDVLDYVKGKAPEEGLTRCELRRRMRLLGRITRWRPLAASADAAAGLGGSRRFSAACRNAAGPSHRLTW